MHAPGPLHPARAADLAALLEWTRRRMLGRAAWVAAFLTAGTAIGGLLTAPGPALGLVGALLGLGGLRAASGAYRFDHAHLPIEWAGKAVHRGLTYDPEARLAPEVLAGSGVFAGWGPVVADEGVLRGEVGGRALQGAVVRERGGACRVGLLVVVGEAYAWEPCVPPRGSVFAPVRDPAPFVAYAARWGAALSRAGHPSAPPGGGELPRSG